MVEKTIIINKRIVDHSINEIFPSRWSPRALSGQQLKKEELFQLFEAARWAPSSSNSQPWKFLYAFYGTPQWQVFFDLLMPFNQEWAKKASVLIAITSKKTYGEGKLSKTHAFDTGMAFQNLALQGSLMNLVVHAVGGLDYALAKSALHIPDDYELIAMAVIGKPGTIKELPLLLQEREIPSNRKKVEEFVVQGHFESSNSVS